jgi:hypothetical protein
VDNFGLFACTHEAEITHNAKAPLGANRADMFILYY